MSKSLHQYPPMYAPFYPPNQQSQPNYPPYQYLPAPPTNGTIPQDLAPDHPGWRPPSCPPNGQSHDSAFLIGPPPQWPYFDNHPRKKVVRAALACESCRERKARCDEGQPCMNCKDNNLSCKYRETRPSKNGKSLIAIGAKLETLQEAMEDMIERFRARDSKLDEVIIHHEHQQQRLRALESGSPSESKHSEEGTSTDNPPDKKLQLSFTTSLPTAPCALRSAAALNLLQWPHMHMLVPSGYKVSHIMDTESARELLHLHNSDEDQDASARHASISSMANSSSEHQGEEIVLREGNRDTAWFLLTSLLDANLVDRYHLSYLENVYRLHPFLEKEVLREMVTKFKERYSWNYRAGLGVDSRLGIKRKRTRTESIEHSITNVIVLLVLALGKICTRKETLPGSPEENGHPAAEQNERLGKNARIIPGLAYFSKAADILGRMPGGVDLSHAQANLLAGLYMGQLGRVLPSYSFIHTACLACQVIVGSAAYREHLMGLVQENLVNFTFWSCLQLESDFRADLDVSVSGLASMEATMRIPRPLNLFGDVQALEEHRHYMFQILLRQILNKSLLCLYGADGDNEPSKSIVHACGKYLSNFRTKLASYGWDWDDNDHQSSDINVARLRWKFYEAKHNISRPVIYYALNSLTPAATESLAALDHGSGRCIRPPPLTSCEPLQDWILKGCESGVHAAMRSITSFDKVPPRLIVTNIVGTAHAQFGNVLVLTATHCSRHPQLRNLINESRLRFILDRTVRFLQQHEALSPSLGKDAVILKHVQSSLFKAPSSSVT